MLMGREAEQDAVARLVAGARVGHSGVLVLTGEPGIGKTALLDQALTHAEGMRVLRAGGSEVEANLAYAGLQQLLRPALHLLDTIPPPQAEALAVALAIREGVTNDRFAVSAAALSLVSRCAESQPVLLLVDDAHVLDRPSAETLVFIGRRLTADPIALLAASRDVPGSPVYESDLPQVALGGLAPEPARALLQAHTRAAPTVETVARLLQATAGNPLAIVELAPEVTALDSLPPHRPLPVPDAVTRSFRRRIDTLPDATRTALLLAAIADGDLALVVRSAKVLGAQAADLAAAEEAGLVEVSAGRVTFRHPLVASSVYAAASQAARRQAHHAVAEALPPGDEDRRAWHASESVMGVDEAVAVSVERAARRAADRSAHDVAATAFERSALLTADLASRCRRFLAAGEQAWFAGRIERAESLLARSAELTEVPSVLADIDGLRGNIALRAGSLNDARTLLSGAASRIAPTDPDAAVLWLADLVTACVYLVDSETAVQAARTVEELLTRSTSVVAKVRGELTVGMARVLAGLPGIDQIRHAVATISASPATFDDPRRPTWEVLGPLFLRESGTGRDLVRRGADELREGVARGTLPTVLFYAARDEATTDRWHRAVSHYQEAIDVARETGDTANLVVCLAGLAWLQARMGREVECRTNADEAARLGDRHHIHLGRIWARFAHGELALSLGHPAQAVTQFEALTVMLGEIGVMDVDLYPGPELAEALVHVGRAHQARSVACDYHEKAVSKGQPWARARAARALAMTAADTSDTESFEAALVIHGSSPDRFEEARTRLAYGSALRRRRQRVASRPQLRAALETFERLGARPWADVCARELEASGETARRRGSDPVDALTPQEFQIAAMLGAGRTTREAAAALFLSPKTVEYHLRHAYTKLGIRSRAELAEMIGGPTKDRDDA